MKALNFPIARCLQLLGLVGLFVLYPGAQKPLSQLELVKESGELTVISTAGPSTVYVDQHGLTGFEYELAKKFAEHLQVKLNVVEANNYHELLSAVDDYNIDFAAANIAATNSRKKQVKFSSPYQAIEQHVVYRNGTKRPMQVKDLVGKRILVVAGSPHAEILAVQKLVHPELTWIETQNIDVDYLLKKVDQNDVDYAIIDSNEYVLHRSLYPALNIAFNIGPSNNLAWAFSKQRDDSLYQAAQQFLAQAQDKGILEDLEMSHYGHIDKFNYFNAKVFLSHIENRLPQYLPTFKKAADEYQLDWRLLAALGYQESLWDPNAVSPTGVRGLMMLTRITANETGVRNRHDPFQSINGGAKYLHKIIQRLPDSLDQNNRLWLALAAYNAGYGHVTDARNITQQQGDDPNNWFAVKRRMPLLTDPSWYKHTRHGYARGGRQSVIYVENVRKYYNLLVWATEHENNKEMAPYTSIAMKSPSLISSI